MTTTERKQLETRLNEIEEKMWLETMADFIDWNHYNQLDRESWEIKRKLGWKPAAPTEEQLRQKEEEKRKEQERINKFVDWLMGD